MLFAIAIYLVLLIFGIVMYVLSSRKNPKDEEYVWVGSGEDPFKKKPIVRN